MTGSEILQRVWDHLGGNTTFYTEPEVIVNGINPAMRLLCLLKPDLLTQRVLVTVSAEQCIVDMREQAPRHWTLRRVVLGDITGASATKTDYGEFVELPYMSLDQLNARSDWFKQRGPIQGYWQHGRFHLGVYKRPEAARDITLVFRAVPTAFTTGTMGNSPAFAAVWHPLVADVSAALLLLKEGTSQIEKARGMLTQAFGKELFGPVKQAVGRQQRTSPVHVKTRAEVAAAS